ncbi:hypothetical protein LT330_009071 [Penicillium expansum]|uniref:Uncharacterized protein n=1 Tax=Penicillium expansum TaxID=27334 RepID=A0A0A2JC58_PENEN|nr:hypothetical protein PEX2_108420 [Penicillium expansum]KAK4865638.1 hypothetical protein LT330_009071 [Penicillium expansum]KGO43852.1 hypothetical protein PEXP_092940 [Penicillium expansum]KGO52183.1 hypothetical protein PEX2_108420 [Penicillium expansum]KGO63221.1 hypothetical protein PEX1_084050 [Penicillium expansum]
MSHRPLRAQDVFYLVLTAQHTAAAAALHIFVSHIIGSSIHTIIPLNPAKSETSSGIDHVLRFNERDSLSSEVAHTDEYIKRAQKYRSLNCNDCNRKFCLDYELPTCKGAKEEDVYTTCFHVLTGSVISERDSRKDEAVVFIFIFATGGLLAWAACKPWIERYVEAARERRSYIPVAEPDR